MYRWAHRLLVIALAGICMAGFACSSDGGGGGGGGLQAGWFDNNADRVYDPYQSQGLWEQMMNTAQALAGHELVQGAVVESGTMAPWVDANSNGICDWVESRAKWKSVCSAPWIDDNGDGICDNFLNRSGGGWAYNGGGKGRWLVYSTSDGNGSGSTPTTPDDITPDQFLFNTVSFATVGNVYESNIITVTGINAPAPITMANISGDDGVYRINGGIWTDQPGTVNNSDTVQLRMTAPTIDMMFAVCGIDISGVQATWWITTGF